MGIGGRTLSLPQRSYFLLLSPQSSVHLFFFQINTHLLLFSSPITTTQTPLSFSILSLNLSTAISESPIGGVAMGFASSSSNPSLYHTRKAFLLSNYILLAAASGCIFLTLSLRLIPSLCGLLLIFLHCLTAVSAGFSCSVGPASSHMAQTTVSSLTAIFQGAVALLALTRTSDFVSELQSYVREDDAEVILKMVGALGLLLFVMEWVVLALAFVLRVEGEGDAAHGSNVRSSKLGNDDLKDWPFPFQV